MIRRRLMLVAFAVATQLYLAAPALAGDDGEGLAGETNDKIITFFALGVLLFLTLVVIIGTIIQDRLNKRYYARLESRKRDPAGW
ncbi:MAG TPA: hypothetical protein VF517_06190 [Thermoleophilaceae bacterium]|jgi:predicted amidohydrolase